MGNAESKAEHTIRNQQGLVIAIDVGTTYSGVSYAFLPVNPADRPRDVMRPVLRFSDIEVGKVPSVVWYSRDGSTSVCGSESTKGYFLAKRDAEGWRRVQRFKMHFRPKGFDVPVSFRIDEMPPRKTPEMVMGDFLRYLYEETMKYIKETTDDGEERWNAAKDNVHFVLSHPNRWEGVPQSRLRQSAIYAGLVSDADDARRRVRFVSEGEASALSCVDVGTIKMGHQFIILDAGGGTLDVSSYKVTSMVPLKLEETSTPNSCFAGSAYVDDMARRKFQARLSDSVLDDGETLESLVEEFESAKRYFRDNNDYYVKVDGAKGRTFEDLGIVNGQMRISHGEIIECFEPSIREAVRLVRSTRTLIEGQTNGTMPVWLVGGFGASPWLLKQMKEILAPLKLQVFKPDWEQNFNLANVKTVAIGAVRHHIYRTVDARVSPYSYGLLGDVPFDPSNSEHEKRGQMAYTTATSGKQIGPAFLCIAKKGEKIHSTQEICARNYKSEVVKPDDAKLTVTLVAHDGKAPAPMWFKEHRDEFFKLCDIKADLSNQCTLQSRQTVEDREFWVLKYSIELTLGSTEISARIKWQSGNETKYSDAQVVYV
ncbi:hypothetical protein SCHPADRAFT_904821 [Schizopora paradoxa]|uniref:Actin-like ATPase domain-containing protein n=1 Tax=Schizopora paradoxa TaxID=27342 RepID=A0A0H2S7E2_9AGAM|nr:hypothetical protein SCHPADRAFT_904821 [Schizopora paradoxa]